MLSASNPEVDKVMQQLGTPPNCARFISGQPYDYVPGKSLTMIFPVQEEYLNPGQTMQGGIITAAFDNVFGPLCWLATGTPATAMVSINTTYHRPIFAGDELKVIASVMYKGKTAIQLSAEAFNSQDKLIAAATCTYIYVNRAPVKE
ncbi:MAG: PaaI family thioesterase [Candidatus Saccharibacteria bacterium]